MSFSAEARLYGYLLYRSRIAHHYYYINQMTFLRSGIVSVKSKLHKDLILAVIMCVSLRNY